MVGKSNNLPRNFNFQSDLSDVARSLKTGVKGYGIQFNGGYHHARSEISHFHLLSIVSETKPTMKFLLSSEMRQLSPLNTCQSHEQHFVCDYIHT